MSEPIKLRVTLPGVDGDDDLAFVVSGDHQDAMAETILTFAQGKVREAKRIQTWGPITGAANMEVLAAMFPELKRYGEGIKPWDADRLDRWAASKACFSDAAYHAARFCLHVWNAHHKWKSKKFDLFAAWSKWDDDHRRGVLAWLQQPFYP